MVVAGKTGTHSDSDTMTRRDNRARERPSGVMLSLLLVNILSIHQQQRRMRGKGIGGWMDG